MTSSSIHLCIVAVGASAIRATEKVVHTWNAGQWPQRCILTTHYVGSDTFSEQQWPRIFRTIAESNFLLLDTMGVSQEFSDALAEGLAEYRGHIVVVNATSVGVRSLTRLGSFSLGMLRRMGKATPDQRNEQTTDVNRMMQLAGWMEKLGKTLPVGPLRDMRNFFWICRYWFYGTVHNIENMLYLIGREYFGGSDFPVPEPPAVFDDCAIMDPESGRVFKTTRAFFTAFPPDPAKPNVALLFRTKSYPLDTHPVTSTLVHRLRQVFNVIPIGLDSIVARDFKKLRALLAPRGTPCIDVLINTEPFRLGQGPVGGDALAGEAFLRELNVPVLHPFLLNKRSRAQWQQDEKGTDVGEFLISIFLPELDGCIETYPVAAVGTPEDQTPELSPLIDRIERLTKRSAAWSRLRRKQNSEKKIALVIYNYPPGEAHLGTSAFLDTFASLAAILQKLSAAGYTTHPLTAADLRQTLLTCSRTSSQTGYTPMGSAHQTIDAKSYHHLTKDIWGMESVEKTWGSFPGTIMSSRDRVQIPGILNGNVFIGIQPARIAQDTASARYHDKHLPPHHQYIAFYRWIEREFQADAIVHIGTHGTLEFLPGKEKALSASCFPDALLGTLPHIYIYYSGNPSEAMSAKRRSHAVLIGHLPPPFRQGDLYEELQELQLLLDEHEEAKNLNPDRCAAIYEDMQAKVEMLGWEWRGCDDLHRKLSDMKAALIPSRLHTLGSGFSDDEIATYLAAYFRTSCPEGNVLYRMLAQKEHADWDTILAEPHRHPELCSRLESHARQWIFENVLSKTSSAGSQPHLPPELHTLVERARQSAEALRHNPELDELLRALEGEFIPPGLAGDMFRTPEILPSGRNLVQFDPRLVPSPSALRQGARIAEQTITRYRNAQGTYPRSVAVVLWGLETSQTQGETVGQILSYLGVRVIKKSGNWESVVELIPLGELGRPRIDVTVQICGFFRDMFPNTLALLQNAFTLAGFAEEPDEMNFVRANARQLFATLQHQGIENAAAREFSLARIFGPAPSEYGTSLEKIVKQQTWQNEADLVSAYIQSLQYVYTPHHYGRELEGLLAANLSRVEVVSQVRSSRDYEITDLDHYYEFFGGLARSVEAASGKKAMMLISDTHEGSAQTEDIHDAISRGIYTRLMNPVWLDGMLKHCHHGGQEIAKRMENLIGLAATTGAVDHTTFDRISGRLVFDDIMRNRIRENNPYALLDIIRRLWEAHRRGYWSPDAQTLDRLKQLYLEAESHLEEIQL